VLVVRVAKEVPGRCGGFRCLRRRNPLSLWVRQGTLTAMSVIIASALPSNPLEALRELAQGEAELGRLRRSSMAAARADGATWEQIGEALGMTRQSAWEYFRLDARSTIARNVAKNEHLTESEAMDAAIDEVRISRRARR
jgi:hypothetical protein